MPPAQRNRNTPAARATAPTPTVAEETPAASPPAPELLAQQAQVALRDGTVRALLAERAQLAQAGKLDRVDQVDEQLRYRGYPTE